VRARRTARLLGAALAVGVLSMDSAPAEAQETSEGSFELGLWKRVSASELIYIPLALTRDEVDHAEGLVGASYVRIIDSTLAVRAGFRYSWELTPPAGEQPYREHRAVAEVTARPWPGMRIELLDRTRFELRWIDGVPAWRLRNRILVERMLARRRRATLTPYGTFEAGYDSRYRTINRLRTSVGLATRVSSHVMLDTYAARQRDSRGDARLQALGMTVNLSY
jgi:hypothetical protein